MALALVWSSTQSNGNGSQPTCYADFQIAEDKMQAALELFVTGLARAYPSVKISCDIPATPAGSTWIDICADVDLVVVEYDPELGFGFADPRDEDDALYGTPSSRFVRTTDEALEEIGRMLRHLATPTPASQSGA